MLSGEENSKCLVHAVKVTGSTVGSFGIRLIIHPLCYLTSESLGPMRSCSTVESTEMYKEMSSQLLILFIITHNTVAGNFLMDFSNTGGNV